MSTIDLEEATDPALLGEDVEPVEVEKVAPVAAVEEPEAPEDDVKKEVHRDQTIPRGRFDEVHAKFKEADERARSLEAELAVERAAKAEPEKIEAAIAVDALENQYAEALMEGDSAQAVKLRAQINTELVKGLREQATESVRAEMSRREQEEAFRADEASFKAAVSEALANFPFLDPKSAEVNKDAIADVVKFRDHYVSKGDPLSTALIKAVNKVAPDYAPAPDNVTKLVDNRTTEAVKRNVADAKKQPVALVSGVGNRAAPSQAVPTKQEDYEKLPEAERERLLA